MALTGTTLRQLPLIVAKRQQDITVPLGLAPYTVDASAPFGFFQAGSLWPVITNKETPSAGGAVVYALYEALAPLQKGKLTLNAANVAIAPVGLTGTPHRWGNVLTSYTRTSPGGLGTKNLIVPGTDLSLASSSYVAMNFADPDYQLDAAGANTVITSDQIIADNSYPLAPAIPNLYRIITFSGPGLAGYTIGMQPINFNSADFIQNHTGILSKRAWDFMVAYNDSALPGGFLQYAPQYIVPDFINKTNYVLITNANLSSWGINLTTMDFLRNWGPGISGVTLDNATIQTIFSGGNLTIQATVFGFLMKCNPDATFFPGQANSWLLLSPDMKKYALIKLRGINGITQSDITNGSIAGQIGHVDPQGCFYLAGAINTRMNTGFITNLSWDSVLLPTIGQPSFIIPGLCGCEPSSYGNPRSPIKPGIPRTPLLS